MWKASIDAVNKYLADQAPTGFWYGQANMNTGARTGTTFGAARRILPRHSRALGRPRSRAQARRLRLQDVDHLRHRAGRNELHDDEDHLRRIRIASRRSSNRRTIFATSQTIRVTAKWARTFFDSLLKYCRTDVGYAALSNVESKTRKDEMESFFFAETLKYLFLLYAPPDTIDLKQSCLQHRSPSDSQDMVASKRRYSHH